MNATLKELDKQKALRQVLSKLKKSHPSLRIGIGTNDDFGYIPTPFPSVNELIGGGIPRGRFTTICGPERTAKGTLLLQTIAHNQAADPNFTVLWTDAEGASQPAWAQHLGVDLDRVILQEYDTEVCVDAENLLQVGLQLLETKLIDMWVIDSISALLPKSENKKDLKEDTMMETSRLMGKFYRKSVRLLRPDTEYKGCACVLIGQVYTVPTATGAGLDAVRGGNAVKHWAHLRVKARRGNKDEVTTPSRHVTQPDGSISNMPGGWAQHLKVEKTRINDKEGQEVILQFVNGLGLDSINSTITTLLANNIVTRSGAWFYHELLPDGKLQGKESLVNYLSSDAQVRDQMLAQLASLSDSLIIEEAITNED